MAMTDRNEEPGARQAAPLVTAIIPFYNRAHTLPRALRSIELQTWPNIEVIIVDDCSQVGPEGVIAEMQPRRPVTVIRLEKNRGPSGARNAGLRAARGRFISFLDSDDEWALDKIEQQMKVVLACGEPDNAFCLSRTSVDFGDGGERVLMASWDPKEESPAEFLFVRAGSLTVNSILLSAAVAKNLAFAEDLRDYEDNLFILQAAAQGAKMLYADAAISVYFRDGRPDQMTHASRVEDGDILLARTKDILTDRERIGFMVQMMGDRLSVERPATFLKCGLRAVKDGVLPARRVGGLIYWFYLKRPFLRWLESRGQRQQPA
jgi:glycosyltransferase involved in cell wall biosynthesis